MDASEAYKLMKSAHAEGNHLEAKEHAGALLAELRSHLSQAPAGLHKLTAMAEAIRILEADPATP